MSQQATTTYLNGSDGSQLNPSEAASESPSAEVIPKAKRRQFSTAYKRRIVQMAERCTQQGEIGALLRREGLYSSQLASWRKQMAEGNLQSSKTRGPKPKQTAEQKENARLQREVARLEKQLAQADLIIEAQKKVSELLGLMSQQHTGSQS